MALSLSIYIYLRSIYIYFGVDCDYITVNRKFYQVACIIAKSVPSLLYPFTYYKAAQIIKFKSLLRISNTLTIVWIVSAVAHIYI